MFHHQAYSHKQMPTLLLYLLIINIHFHLTIQIIIKSKEVHTLEQICRHLHYKEITFLEEAHYPLKGIHFLEPGHPLPKGIHFLEPRHPLLLKGIHYLEPHHPLYLELCQQMAKILMNWYKFFSLLTYL